MNLSTPSSPLPGSAPLDRDVDRLLPRPRTAPVVERLTPARDVLLLNWRDLTNPEGGGSELYVEQVAARLAARGDRVTLLCAAHANAPRD